MQTVSSDECKMILSASLFNNIFNPFAKIQPSLFSLTKYTKEFPCHTMLLIMKDFCQSTAMVLEIGKLYRLVNHCYVYYFICWH